MPNPSPSEQSIFLEALQKDAAMERAAFLDQICGSDRKLKADVQALLEAHNRLPNLEPVSLSSHEPLTAAAPPPISEGPGTVIGQYKLLEQIGEGGFGLVFMAEQKQPIRRKVALKILKPGMDTRQVVARFEAERQALALMDHPNIAGVFDGGETASGRPYFVMELVKGLTITAHCDQNRLTPRERLELFIHVCHAVQHAHQKGIIHRDLKPSNILITLHDGAPVVKVIDFGIAKATGPQLTEKTLFTNFAQLIGTPEYMSPEQAGQSGLDVDTRSDIYSLGVLLYELLTGRTPLGRKRFKEADYDEIRRLVREEEPPKLSTRVSTLGEAGTNVAAQRKSDPKQLSKLFRGELDWIAMKALDKDRTRRYETANGLAADLRRYLEDEPVQACPPSAWYRFRKFTRRNKGKLVIAACVVLALAVLTGGVGWNLQQRAQRVARTTAGVEMALQQVEQLQKDKQWSEALAAMNRAEGLLAGGEGSADLHKRLRLARGVVERRLWQEQTDQKMVAELAEIRLKQAEVKNNNFDMLRADDDYPAAFRAYGIDVENLQTADAAARIRKREIASELVAALDHWVEFRRRRKPQEVGWKNLMAVAKAADPEPFRNQVRAALESQDRKALIQLAKSNNISSLPPSTLLLLGWALRETDASNEAVVLFKRAQLEYPGDFWINHALAMTLANWLQPPQHQKAIPYFTAALAIRKSLGAYNNLSISLRSIGALDEAIAVLQHAIRLQPDYAKAHVNLGIALQKIGRFGEAKAAYQEAIRLQPDKALAYTNLGAALADEGFLEDAISMLQDAVRLKPDFAAAHFQLGDALASNGRADVAKIAYEEAIRLMPDAGAALNNLAWLLANAEDVRLRDPKLALGYAKEAVKLQPNNADNRNTLGAVHYRNGEWQAAVEALRKAMEFRPESDVYKSYDYFFMAMAVWQLGDKDKAREWYDQGVRWLDGQVPNEPANRARIERFRAEAAELLGVTNPKKT
jgi:serine/threonine protein kinase/tetratricopeptide (TPR) repeat protein